MLDFYARLERLRDDLATAGLDAWSRALLTAERSASTSGEAISNTSEVLRQLDASSEPLDDHLRTEVRDTLAEASRIWGLAQ